MIYIFCIALILASAHFSSTAPVDPNLNKENNVTDATSALEYERYLKEVIQVLEQDEEFRNKVQNTPVDQLRSGLIANELKFVNHNVRTQLDEIKRRELLRLRQLALQQMEQNQGPNRPRLKLPSHVNHLNPASFEIQDLAMLIKQANKDLEEVDRLRKEEFKRYEMEKEHVRREKIKQLDENQRAEEVKKHEEMQKKHKEHDPLHHPGSKQQLEEVWVESDGLDKSDFDVKTFFKLHDLNQDGYLDATEIESIFQQELDKVYNAKAPEDDMVERSEEMSRMREHVMKEVDNNKDGLISWDEFLSETKKKEFEQDDGWKTIDEDQVYNEKELEEYERQRAREEQMRLQYEVARAQAGYQMHPNQIPHQSFQPLPHQNFQQYPLPGHFPQVGHGQFMQPGQGQFIQPGTGQFPHPNAGQFPQPGIGQFPQPGVGQFPQPGFQQLPQKNYQQLPQQGFSQQGFQQNQQQHIQGQLKQISPSLQPNLQQLPQNNHLPSQQVEQQSQQVPTQPHESIAEVSTDLPQKLQPMPARQDSVQMPKEISHSDNVAPNSYVPAQDESNQHNQANINLMDKAALGFQDGKGNEVNKL